MFAAQDHTLPSPENPGGRIAVFGTRLQRQVMPHRAEPVESGLCPVLRKGGTMSSLIIEVCRVDSVELHPNADRMAIARVKGWRTCINRDPNTGKLQFERGDRCVYVPPDSA